MEKAKKVKAISVIPVIHNCEFVCKNYGRKVRAPISVDGSFEKGQKISICQICNKNDHLKLRRKS